MKSVKAPPMRRWIGQKRLLPEVGFPEAAQSIRQDINMVFDNKEGRYQTNSIEAAISMIYKMSENVGLLIVLFLLLMFRNIHE